MKNQTYSKGQGEVVKRLLSYAKPHVKLLSLAFLLLVLATAADIAGPYLVKLFIDDYLTPRYLPVEPIVTLVIIYLSVHIGAVFFNYFQLFLFQKTALLIIQDLRVDVFSRVHDLGLKFFDQTPGGSLVSRITNDTEAIKDLFVSVLSTFVQNFIFVIGIFGAMFFLDYRLAFFSMFILPFIYLIMRTYRTYSSKYYHALREKLSQLNAKISESLQGMTIIQMFRQEKRLRKEFGVINDEHYEAGMKNIKLDGLLLRPAVDLVFILSLMLVLSYFGVNAMESPVEIGVLYAFVNYLERFFEPVNQMMQRLSIFQQAVVSASRVFKLIDEKEVAPRKEGDGQPSITKGEIEFKNVSFSYDGKRDVLKNISFTAREGETIALVGHTGSGKSSIINLLMRFYSFERGDILIDGQSIREYDNGMLRDNIGLVLQDPFLFVGSVSQNIRLYNDRITEEEVEDAARFVQAHSFIEKLPNGYEHSIGERGSTFSSGQRQLLAFARTMAMNPKILVLDEATANIDTETEQAIQTALRKMRKGRTTIAIAHRLSTIHDADQILVLHQGEIVERGTHQQLLKQKGLYHKMYLLQHGMEEEASI